MIKYEKLSSANWNEFTRLHSLSISSHYYDRNFINYYNNQNFFTKAFLKKFVKLYKYNDKYIGYLWHEPQLDINIKVWSLYFEKSYTNKLSTKLLSNFDNSILQYEAVESKDIEQQLHNLGFKISKPTLMMDLATNTYKTLYNNKNIDLNTIKLRYSKITDVQNINDINDINITTKPYVEGLDEGLRCIIQNKIFESSDREMLTADDIINDTMQEYYINGMSEFLLIDNLAVGFGQIIFSRDIYILVNFGIVPEFRGLGLGKLLLDSLISLCAKNNIDTLHLRVDNTNSIAMQLYTKTGFKKIFNISSYERTT